MELLEDVIICCNRCRETIQIPKEEFDYNSYVNTHGDNGMGNEIVYIDPPT